MDSVGVKTPIGHLGADGWALAYQFAWSKAATIPSQVYYESTRKTLDEFDTLDMVVPREEQTFHGPASCCMPLAIPRSVWAPSLLPVCAQARDSQMVTKVTKFVEQFLIAHEGNDHFLKINEGPEWSVGASGNFVQGLILARNSHLLRNLAVNWKHSAIPGEVFVESIEPSSCCLWRCANAQGRLLCGMEGTTWLELKLGGIIDVGRVAYVSSTTDPGIKWTFDTVQNVLRVEHSQSKKARVEFEVVVEAKRLSV